MKEIGPVDIRPGVGVLGTFRHYGYKPWFAIGEFIDNSVSSYIQDSYQFANEKLVVEVIFDEVRQQLRIIDNAGGIRPEDFNSVLVAGTPPKDKSTLHQFGLGLKTAAFWWGARLKVETKLTNTDEVWTVDVDLSDTSPETSLVQPYVRIDPHFNHGTVLTIDDLWPERVVPSGRTLGKIRSYLASIYRDYIRDGRLTLVVSGKELESPETKTLIAPRWDDLDSDPVAWRKDVEVDFGNGRLVTGWVGLLETGDTLNAGLVLTWRGKAIVGTGAGADDANDAYRPRSVFGSSNSFESQRVFGELDVSCFPVTSRKDGIEWSDEEQEYLATSLSNFLDLEPLPLLKMAKYYRKRIKADPVDTNKIFEQVAQSLSAMTFETDEQIAAGQNTELAKMSSGDIELSLARAEETYVVQMASPFLGLKTMRVQTQWLGEMDNALYSYVEGESLVIRINMNNKFMVNFAQRPQYDIEPIVRLFAALALAEYEALAEGVRNAERVTWLVNKLLSRQLGQPFTTVSKTS